MRSFSISSIAAAIAIAALAFAGNAFAQIAAAPTDWQEGKHYFAIDPPQPTTTGDKVEVTEVFSYGCPACNASYPYVDKLKKDLPANAVMTFVPAAFNPAEDWPMFQRAYLAAKALGVADKAHDAMFDAVWKSGELAISDKTTNRPKQPLPSIEDAAKFYTKYGAKEDEFVATANSFTINTRMKQADAYIKAAGVEQTPTIIVNGKYRLTVPSAGDWNKVEELVLYLVRKESGGK
ncbi:MAG TPA: thiol:disulfide interchange protein DsbA/DsbL [Rudaea sp.]|jgi:thiol:disulfide interchange protein DsbA|nr:thiol:disulfide interchange protein DsbA/DsbL [Rudaea sp.]